MKEIGLTRGYAALVDDDDYAWVSQWKWTVFCDPKSGKKYAFRNSGLHRSPFTYLMHRVILDAPKGLLVDHINGDGLDNRRCNLRLCNRSQNGANRTGPVKNKHGFRGVFQNKAKFDARVMVNYEYVITPGFLTPEDAAKAYDEMAIKHFGEFATTNRSLGLLNDDDQTGAK